MRLFWDNFIDAAATVISQSSEATKLPGENVAHQHKEKVWQTGTSLTNEWISFDLGSARAVDGFVLLNHDLDGTETGVNIEANSADTWGSPALSQSVTVASTDPAFHYWSSGQSYRYWRFEFTKASAATARNLGRIFLGDVYTLTEDPDFLGFQDDKQDLSTSKRAIGGQLYHDIRNQFDRFKIDFRKVGVTQANQLRTIMESVGVHTPFFMQVDEDASDDVREEMKYVKFIRALRRKVSAYDSELKFDFKLELEEQL